jgi:hypothetical protein
MVMRESFQPARRISLAKPLFVLAAVALGFPGASMLWASDGRLVINQACVASGCFEGDAPGWPVEISRSGAYVLTGNLNNRGTADAVRIVPSVSGLNLNLSVDLDLNGFSIRGPFSCNGHEGAGFLCNFPAGPPQSAQTGIRVQAPLEPLVQANVHIHGGFVRGFYTGIHLGKSSRGQLRDVSIMHCDNGIYTDGPTIMERVSASDNRSSGFWSLGGGATPAQCRDCVAVNNGYGANGTFALDSFTASRNRQVGVQLYEGSTARGLLASHNGGPGLGCTGGYVTYSGSTLYGNSGGVGNAQVSGPCVNTGGNYCSNGACP